MVRGWARRHNIVSSSGAVCARLVGTGKPVCLQWHDDLITGLGPAGPSLAPEGWLAPPLLDLQINGFAGVDFQQDSVPVEDLLRAARGLWQAGCPRWLLTLMTAPWPVMLSRLQRLRALRSKHPELQRAIVGWHLEGPFLSSLPGFCGAHNPAWMEDPSPAQMREIRTATGSDPVLLTLAPERSGALESIAVAESLGMRVSLGHTDASLDCLRRAVEAGATGFTHLGNACPQALDRHDNILWRALDTAGLTMSLIPDGAHVSPPLFRLVHRVLSPEALYYTSDAVAAAGAVPGRYTVGMHEVEVGPDQIVRQPGKTNFAGSGLRPVDGVFRAARMLGRPWQEVWPFFSSHPARLMGLPIGLGIGDPADFCVIQTGDNQELQSLRLFVAGIDTSTAVG